MPGKGDNSYGVFGAKQQLGEAGFPPWTIDQVRVGSRTFASKPVSFCAITLLV